MRVVTISEYGGPDVLTIIDAPVPKPGPDDVLIQVAAAGINRADLLQRAGHYPPPDSAPRALGHEIPGLECSGTIAALGDEVVGWQLGDRVAALVDGGSYAEYVSAPASQLLAVPESVDVVEAAGIPEALYTAWSNLFAQIPGLARTGEAQPGETVLIHGGSGGVGSMAIQLARSFGCAVAATAGSAARAERCVELGADVAIDYSAGPVSEKLLKWKPTGADVIFDVLGAGAFADNLAALATRGRLVIIGTTQGHRAEVNLLALMAKRASVIATTLRSRPAAEKAAIVADAGLYAGPWLTQGAVRPVIDTVIPLAEAPEAHRYLAEGKPFGKVLLTS